MVKRNAVIDIAKGIGIILVVFGHNWLVLQEKGEIYRIIYSFHIPLFLFISGILLKDSDLLGEFTLSRVETLWKPYLTVFLVISILKTLLPTSNSAITVSPLVFFLRALYATPGYIIWDWLPLWYLPHLFVASIISRVILRATEGTQQRNNWVSSIAILCLVTGIWVIKTDWLENPRPPFTSDVVLISSGIILIGFLLKEQIQLMVFNLPMFLATVFVFSLSHYFFDDTIDLSLRVYTHLITSSLQMFLGIYMTLSISLVIKEYEISRRILTYVGSGSLFILMFHNFVQERIYWKLLALGYGDQPGNAISFVSGVILPLVFWEIVKRQRFLSAMLLPHKSRGGSI